MAGKTVSFSEEDKGIVKKLNGLLEQLHVPNRVRTVADIGAGVFVTLYEGLCGEQLPGIVRNPGTREDEIHNAQTVINSLAGDVLHTSLTHISGADIIDGSREAITNLAEIFSGLLEYMLNKIESDASTDNDFDDRDADFTQDDPDLMTPDVIDRILESELKRERLVQEATGLRNGGPTAVWVEEVSPEKGLPAETRTTQDLITTDRETADPSVMKGDMGDSTLQLIQESERVEKQLQTQISQPTRTQTTSTQPQQMQVHADRLSPVKDDQGGIIKGLSKREDIIRRIENDPRYKSVLPGLSGPAHPDVEEDDEESPEFDTLQNMVEETAAMARAAVDASPARAKSLLETLDKVHSQRRNTRNAARREKSPFTGRHDRLSPAKTSPTKSRGVPAVGRSRKDLTDKTRVPSTKRPSPSGRRPSPGTSYRRDQLSDSELTPSRAKRKVSFLVDRSTTDSSPSFVRGAPSPSKAWEDRARYRSPQRRDVRPSAAPYRHSKGSGSYLDLDDVYSDKENEESYEARLRRQFHDIVDDVLSDEESPARSKGRNQKSLLAESAERGLFSINDTQKLMEKEKQAGKKKIGFLQKIYKEDLDELLDEAHYQINRNRETARETEAEYRKKMLTGIKQSASTSKAADPNKQAPSVLKKKKTGPKTFVSSKAKRSTPVKGYMTQAQAKPLEIQDDADILPLLLDEFPHLHLSIHTWHELWRKGLQQIEQITRSHQEVRRKKSRAQDQLEEAEKRQEIMVNIMKKELEHGHRLKEIKDRQALAISTKNKLHERRMQSARSRHYYDEYQVRMRSKMLKRRTKEEMVFKKLFKDGLEIQKDRIRELRKYAREQRDGQAKQQRDEIESMENYYRDQFQMLAESIAREKKDVMIREKAQQKVLSGMKKELRKKMESEIKQLQEQLVRDDDDAYFRQLDADRVVHDLHMAKYKVRV